jgi:bilirubin oxidase
MSGPDTFSIDIAGCIHNFDPEGAVSNINLNVALPTYCYNQNGSSIMTYLGPTLIFEKGDQQSFNIVNNLPNSINTTVHWHGLNIPAKDDGGPHQVILNGSTWTPGFMMIDPVQTCWYHTHLMNETTDQVIRGLAGLIIVKDNTDPLRAQLPHSYGENDFPIIIQEKGFNLDSTTNPPTATSIIAGEKPGNGPYTLINGVVGGVLHVPPEIVRLRILNGSPRKMFHIGLSPQLNSPAVFANMWMVATSGGYVANPLPTNTTLMSVGDRREFLVDFSFYNNGDTIYMSNLSVPADANYGTTAGSALMAFVIDDALFPANPITSIPTTLEPYNLAPGPVFKDRVKELLGSGGSAGVWTIDGTPMDLNVINDTVLVNTKERWTIVNTTNKAHPFHIHKVQFQVVEYSGKIGTDSVDMTVTFPNLPDELIGYKDVQLIRAGATMVFEARFDSFPSPLLANEGYMYHCHILTHEDTSMMHQFVVVDSIDFFSGLATIPGTEPLIVYPNPAQHSLSIHCECQDPGKLLIYDLGGRLIRQEDVLFAEHLTMSVADLPRGVVIMQLISGDKHFISKVTLH